MTNRPIVTPSLRATHGAIRNGLAGVAMAALVAGCAGGVAPRGDASVAQMEKALSKGRTGDALAHAEAAVLAEPRHAAYRAKLGHAYLRAGRFDSAETALADALQLGHGEPRVALALALMQVANGKDAAARATLAEWGDRLDVADHGLALALAGEPDRGVAALAQAVRAGDTGPKMRQNLAYAYALAGNWRTARVMAAQDVPADQLDARIGQWAQSARPDDYRRRVAELLNVAPAVDTGLPAALALANNPGIDQLAETALAARTIETPANPAAELGRELAPLADKTPVTMTEADIPASRPATGRASVATAFALPALPERGRAAAPAPVAAPQGATPVQLAANTVRFVSNPVIQSLPAVVRRAMAEPEARRTEVVARAPRAADRTTTPAATRAPRAERGDHLVQLGSFKTRAEASRAWTIFTGRHPELADYDLVVSEARVKGGTWFRVAAGGLTDARARSVCGTVQRAGHGCIAYARNNPLPGVVERDIRVAAR